MRPTINHLRPSVQNQKQMIHEVGNITEVKIHGNQLLYKIDQDDLGEFLREWYDEFDLFTKKFFSAEPRNPQKHFVIVQDHLMISILKQWQKFQKFHHGIGWAASSHSFCNFNGIDGESMEIEWNIFQNSTLCSSDRSQTFTVEIWWDTREFQRKTFIHDNVQWLVLLIKSEKACQMLDSFLFTQRDLEEDNGHSLVLVPKRSGSLSAKTVQKENALLRREQCWWN